MIFLRPREIRGHVDWKAYLEENFGSKKIWLEYNSWSCHEMEIFWKKVVVRRVEVSRRWGAWKSHLGRREEELHHMHFLRGSCLKILKGNFRISLQNLGETRKRSLGRKFVWLVRKIFRWKVDGFSGWKKQQVTVIACQIAWLSLVTFSKRLRG